MQHSEKVTLFFYNTQDDHESFENETFTVRTYLNSDGSIWFCAMDVCEILDLPNHHQAISTLDHDEKLGVSISDPHGREQITSFVSESGLYALIFKSRKPEAKRFRKWVTSEVLPSIRKTGSYTVNQESNHEVTKPVPVPVKNDHVLKTVKRPTRGIPQGVMKAAEKILKHTGIDDFQMTLALDAVFKGYTGESILEMAGIRPVVKQKEPKRGRWGDIDFNNYVDVWGWECDYPSTDAQSTVIDTPLIDGLF